MPQSIQGVYKAAKTSKNKDKKNHLPLGRCYPLQEAYKGERLLTYIQFGSTPQITDKKIL